MPRPPSGPHCELPRLCRTKISDLLYIEKTLRTASCLSSVMPSLPLFTLLSTERMHQSQAAVWNALLQLDNPLVIHLTQFIHHLLLELSSTSPISDYYLLPPHHIKAPNAFHCYYLFIGVLRKAKYLF